MFRRKKWRHIEKHRAGSPFYNNQIRKTELIFQDNKLWLQAQEAQGAAARYFAINMSKDKIIEDLKWELEGMRQDRNRWRERCLNFIDRLYPIANHKPSPSVRVRLDS